MANLTIKQIIGVIKDIADRHKQIQMFGYGATSEISDSKSMDFPYLWVSLQNNSTIVSNDRNKLTTVDLEMSFIVADYINNVISTENGQESTNGLEVTSDIQQILFDIVSEINQHPFYVTNRIQIKNDVTFSPSFDSRDSKVNIMVADLTISMPLANLYCDAPIEPLPNTPINATPERELFFVFEDGSDGDYTATIGGRQTGTYSTQALTNVATLVYKKNAVITSLPFTLAVGDTLEIITTATTSGQDVIVEIKGNV